MTKVTVREDCGNSPKNLFLQHFVAALGECDPDFILSRVTDDFCWSFVGGRVIEGKENLAQALEGMKKDPTLEMGIHHIASHGKAGAVDGTLKLQSGRNVAFCDVFEFGSAKGTSIKGITSYVIDIK